MATGYIRQDVANEIADGEFISADPLDAEFDGLVAAFNATTGHAHDGTVGNGGPITMLGPGQDLVVSSTQVLPETTNTLDLGSGTFKFKDAYFDGVVNSDSFVGPLTGAVTGNASTATALQTARTIAISGQVTGTATSFDGTANIAIAVDELNASSLNAGTVPNGRMTGSYTGITGTGALAAGSIASGFGNINIGSNIFTGVGSGITAINASNISTGTIAAARLPNHSADLLTSGTLNNSRLPSTISVTTLEASGGTFSDEFQATSDGTASDPSFTFASDTNSGWWTDPGVSWTWSLNGTNRVKFDSTGVTTLVTGDGFTGKGSNLTDLNASEITSGTVPSARISGSYTGITGVGTLAAGSISAAFGDIDIGGNTFTGNGSGLTDLSASQLTSGTMPIARFGTSASYADWVRERTSENSVGEIGMYALLRQSGGSAQSPGDTLSGSTLTYASAGGGVVGGNVSGTWRCMGRTVAGTSEDATTLWMRIS